MILAHVLLSKDVSRGTMTPLPLKALNGALHWEGLDDLHHCLSKGTKEEKR